MSLAFHKSHPADPMLPLTWGQCCSTVLGRDSGLFTTGSLWWYLRAVLGYTVCSSRAQSCGRHGDGWHRVRPQSLMFLRVTATFRRGNKNSAWSLVFSEFWHTKTSLYPKSMQKYYPERWQQLRALKTDVPLPQKWPLQHPLVGHSPAPLPIPQQCGVTATAGSPWPHCTLQGTSLHLSPRCKPFPWLKICFLLPCATAHCHAWFAHILLLIMQKFSFLPMSHTVWTYMHIHTHTNKNIQLV